MTKTKVIDKRGKDYGVDTSKDSKIITTLNETVTIPKAPDYSKINLEMKGDRMLIQTFPAAEKIGSIWTPDNREIQIDKGRVCAIGPGVKNIKVGDIIYKMEGLGQTIKSSDGGEYIFLPENAAIAVDKDFKDE